MAARPRKGHGPSGSRTTGAAARAAVAPSTAPARRSRAALLGGGAGLLALLGVLAFVQGGSAKLPFDGERAYADLKKQVEFGPRVPGMAGHKPCLEYMESTLKPLADSVERQDFTFRLSATRKLEMTNLIARFKGTHTGPGGSAPILLCAHWDTRPQADQDPHPDYRNKPIPGANDGASEVAVLLEAARQFKQRPPAVPVMLVFFDGEDYGPGIERMFLGSVYFADHLPADVPKRGVLLDMIGDRELTVPQEFNSIQRARSVVEGVYGTAKRLGYEKQFPARTGLAIEDDHLPLLQKGLQVIDLIDFDYGPNHGWWHTLEDTPDKCSAASLKVIGDTITEWVYSQH